MATTTRRSLELLEDANIRGMFWEQWEGANAPSWVDAIAGSAITSDSSKEEYSWMGTAPNLAPSTGQLNVARFSADAFEIRNAPFDAAAGCQIDKWRRDKTGRLRDTIVNQLAAKSVSHWAKLLTTLIENGASTAGPIDGQYYFDTDHTAGTNGSQKNAITASDYASLAFASLANPTSAEFANAVYASISQFFALLDDQGDPRNENAKDFTVMVPVKWMRAAQAAASLRLVTDGAKTIDNALLESGFRINVVVNPRLTAANNKFYVFRNASDGLFSALIRQSEPIDGQEVKFSFLGETSEHCFIKNEVVAKIEASRNVGYGDWWRAMQATCSAS